MILRDIIAVRAAGASGIVIGMLRADGTIDVASMKLIRNLTKDMRLTFHRAFDICTQSIQESLLKLNEFSCDRLLTSGKMPSITQGKENVKEIVSIAKTNGKPIEIIGGSGINLSNVRDVIDSTGVFGIHVGSAIMEQTALPEDLFSFGHFELVSLSKAIEFVDECEKAFKNIPSLVQEEVTPIQQENIEVVQSESIPIDDDLLHSIDSTEIPNPSASGDNDLLSGSYYKVDFGGSPDKSSQSKSH